MRKLTFILIVASLAGLLSSCNPCSYMAKRCPAQIVKDSVHVTEKDSVVLRDSVVYVPRDSFRIVLKDSVPCKDFKATQKDQKGNKVTVEVKEGVMTVDAQCEDAKVKLEWFEHHYKKIVEKFHSEERTVTVKKKSGAFYRWWFWITAILIALRIAFYILKKTGTFPITIKRSG